MTAKPIYLATATAAALVAGLALAQQHQFRQDAPRGAAPARMHAPAPAS